MLPFFLLQGLGFRVQSHLSKSEKPNLQLNPYSQTEAAFAVIVSATHIRDMIYDLALQCFHINFELLHTLPGFQNRNSMRPCPTLFLIPAIADISSALEIPRAFLLPRPSVWTHWYRYPT